MMPLMGIVETQNITNSIQKYLKCFMVHLREKSFFDGLKKLCHEASTLSTRILSIEYAVLQKRLKIGIDFRRNRRKSDSNVFAVFL